MAMQHVALSASSRLLKRGMRYLRDADSLAVIEVTVALRGPELPDFSSIPSQSLSLEEFTAQYSASPDDANTVVQFLKGSGLTIEEVSLPTHSIRASGTVAAMEAAFHVGIGIYEHAEQGAFYGHEDAINLPPHLSQVVTGVFGLDQRHVVSRSRLIDKAQVASPAARPTAPPAPLTAADLEKLYTFPPGDASGQRIAIAEVDGGYSPDDMQALCNKMNRPMPSITIVPVNAQPASTASVETMLDVEIIGSLCPKADIAIYFTTRDEKGIIDLLNRVILDRPVVLSISWGCSEDDRSTWTESSLQNINKRLGFAAALGTTVCVAAGDSGASDGCTEDKHCHVDFPASSPFVLGVGGTMIIDSVEQTWWECPGYYSVANGTPAGGSTGGGVSAVFSQPSWQNVQVVALDGSTTKGRVVPDVAALAGPPHYLLKLLGGDNAVGGTSAAAPLWAALIARINAILPPDKQRRFLTPILYRTMADGHTLGALACNDITSGSNASSEEPNLGYKAQIGYDAVTGWGTPNGLALLQMLQTI